MSVLVVIPCLNEEKYLEPLVQNLLNAPCSMPMRIVIADGGSTDQTISIAQRLATEHPEKVFYLPNPKRIQSTAVNLAVETYGMEDTYLIRLDAHAEYPPDYCQILIDEAESTKAAAVVVAMETKSNTEGFQNAVAIAQNSFLGNGGSAHRSVPEEGKWVEHGHHALIRIEPFRLANGYDETFSHNEDAELDTRLRKAKQRIWLTAKTHLTYYPRSKPLDLFMQYYNFGQGRARTIMKHQMTPGLRQIAPAAVLPATLLAFLGSGTALELPFTAWAVICLGYGFLLAYRDKDPKLALTGPAAMIMHFAWSVGFWKAVVMELYNNLMAS